VKSSSLLVGTRRRKGLCPSHARQTNTPLASLLSSGYVARPAGPVLFGIFRDTSHGSVRNPWDASKILNSHQSRPGTRERMVRHLWLAESNLKPSRRRRETLHRTLGVRERVNLFFFSRAKAPRGFAFSLYSHVVRREEGTHFFPLT
jgi:hypothetical protein